MTRAMAGAATVTVAELDACRRVHGVPSKDTFRLCMAILNRFAEVCRVSGLAAYAPPRWTVWRAVPDVFARRPPEVVRDYLCNVRYGLDGIAGLTAAHAEAIAHCLGIRLYPLCNV